jgi:hypothetical protein
MHTSGRRIADWAAGEKDGFFADLTGKVALARQT